ncbi:uncharacterized protein LOC125240217 [Leguminivora glycinivorella]|uniref:uncharacterized protein LOC125240217 n=1 Tax=Leguminivora glycinivorella TaxID=1035111 RepID=UPI00200C1218|nr:uncharacterized protein LOC125240217 [Leguminivora glycinivorella]
MNESSKLVFLNFIFLLVIVQICRSEPAQHLSLHSPEPLMSEAEYLEVLIRRVGDNLTLVCEIKGDRQPRLFVWNYVAANGSSSHRRFAIEPSGPTPSTSLVLPDLQPEDSGRYICSSPPSSVTKFVLVQAAGSINCARGAFSCGDRCVLPTYVCDGHPDCRHGEDEAPPLCPPSVCQQSGMLNCSTGRCISAAACCPTPNAGPLCLQHSCCSEHDPYRTEGFVEIDFPASYEDKHAPDQYGFIQSTIYTVTACALIFMIAAVLLVSAICKMHMKRAALRSYARAAAQRNYMTHPPPRYPPCYEASRLLEQAANAPPIDIVDMSHNNMQTTPDPVTDDNPDNAGFGLSRLSSIFSSRYRQVPTTCDVEMTTVRPAPASLDSSPARRPRLRDYRSPTYDDLNQEYFLNAETGNCGRELNYMSPVEMYRSRLDLDRRLTLQLGRFQLSLPRFGRERPGTPNVAEINIHDLDFVRHSADTYTLNGRTIRLLGANFSTCPRPPPYSWRKAGGPPPDYVRAAAADADADNNSEMPPRYEDVNSNEEHIERVTVSLNAIRESGESLDRADQTTDRADDNMNSIAHMLATDNIPAIDDVNANEIVGD